MGVAQAEWSEALQQFIKTPQAVATVLGATVGFIGVSATILANGWLARKADSRKSNGERRAEEDRREHERQVLRVALRAELQSLSRTVSREIGHIKNSDFTWVPILSFFKIYDDNVDKLGLLTPREVEFIVRAYYTYQEETGYIARLGKVDVTKPIIGTNVELKFDGEDGTRNRDWSLGSLKAIRAGSEEAIESIEYELGIRKQTGIYSGL